MLSVTVPSIEPLQAARSIEPVEGRCSFCGHGTSEVCFRADGGHGSLESIPEHEKRCVHLSLCPATLRIWCDRHPYFEADQRWGIVKKPICSKCEIKNYVNLKLTTRQILEPDLCQDCGEPATVLVFLEADPYSSLADFEMFRPNTGGLANVSGSLGLPRTKAQVWLALRIESGRNVKVSRLKE